MIRRTAAVLWLVAAKAAGGPPGHEAAPFLSLAGDARGACKYTAAALTSGKSPEEVRQTDELKSMKGCGAYDQVVHAAR